MAKRLEKKTQISIELMSLSTLNNFSFKDINRLFNEFKS